MKTKNEKNFLYINKRNECNEYKVLILKNKNKRKKNPFYLSIPSACLLRVSLMGKLIFQLKNNLTLCIASDNFFCVCTQTEISQNFYSFLKVTRWHFCIKNITGFFMSFVNARSFSSLRFHSVTDEANIK